MDLANRYRPSKFADYVAKGTSVEAVTLIQNLISRNLHAQVNKMVLRGKPGTGKSTLALLYARATLCPNRQEGEYEPCGTCPICTGQDTSNIFHYTITNSTEAREPIKQLIEASQQHPITASTRADQYRKFIILDEIELASAELIGSLLDPIEYCPASTTWILLTMDPEKLEKRDPIIKEAIDSRCSCFDLARLNEEDIAVSLCKGYPDLVWETALILAELSKGNMRAAWNQLGSLTCSYDVQALTPELLLELKLGGVDQAARRMLWQALADSDAVKLKELYAAWSSKLDDQAIAGLLTKDLLEFMSGPNQDIQLILIELGRWHLSYRYPLLSLLMSHLGANVLIFPDQQERILRQDKKKATLPKTTAKEQLAKLAKHANQLEVPSVSSSIKETPKELPKVFDMTLSELLKAFQAQR